jgi:hypothetical protein
MDFSIGSAGFFAVTRYCSQQGQAEKSEKNQDSHQLRISHCQLSSNRSNPMTTNDLK